MNRSLAWGSFALFLAVAACGVETGGDEGSDPTIAAPVLGPFTVPEARAVSDGPMRVSGSVLRVAVEAVCDPGATCPAFIYELHLCGAMTRSIPPRCVGEFFWLRGVDPASIDFQEAPDGTGWSAPLLIEGRKQGDAFIGDRVDKG